jgi:hypothetical protein
MARRTLRERLNARFRRTARRTLGRLSNLVDPPTTAQAPENAPIPSESPQARPTPLSPAPADEGGASPADPAEAANLLGQLSDLTLATNEIVRRLTEMGHIQAAQAVLGIPDLPSAAPQAPPPEPAPGVPTAPTAPTAPTVPTAPPMPPAPDGPGEEPPKEPVEPPDDGPERPGKRYPLRGSNIYIPHVDPESAFDTLLSEWDRARIGLKSDAPNQAIPPYAPDAVARGNNADPGLQIPPAALRSKGSFLEWAKGNGYGEGMSIVVDGLIAMPGRTVIVSPGRPAEPTARSAWTPPAERAPRAKPATPALPAKPASEDTDGFDWSSGAQSDDDGEA